MEPLIADSVADQARGPFTLTVNHVAQQLDQTMAGHLMAHFMQIDKNPKLMEKLRAEIDFQPHYVQPFHVVQRIERQIQLFTQTLLPTIHDMPSFQSACFDYIDTQLEQLFFYNNDRASARITKDYLTSFVKASREALVTQGLCSKEEEKIFDEVLRYADHGIRSYENMRSYIAKDSPKDSPSLIAFTLKELNIEPVQGDKAMVEMPDTLLPEVRKKFGDVLGELGLDFKEAEPHPSLFAVAQSAFEYGVHKRGQEKGSKPGDDIRIDRQLLAHGRDALRGALDIAQKDGDTMRSILAMQEFVDQKRDSVDALPEAIDSVLKPIHDLALLEGSKAIKDSRHPIATKFQPNCGWFPSMFSLAPNEQARGQGMWQETAPALYDSLLASRDLKGIVTTLDKAVDDAAYAILTGGYSPKIAEGMQAYIASFRRELGKALVEKGLFDEAQFVRLKHVEDKCTLALESYYALQPMVMNETNNGFDDCYIHGIFQVMADTGTRPDKFDELDYKRVIHLSEAMYEQVLKGQDLYERHLLNPYTPALLVRCQHLVGLRHQRDPNSMHDPLQQDAQARVMLTTLLDSMPRDPGDKHKLKQIVMDASVLRRKLMPMERETGRLEYQNPTARNH